MSTKYLFFYVYVCVCLCVSVSPWVHMSMSTCGSQRAPLVRSTLGFEAGSLVGLEPAKLGKPQGFACLYFPIPGT